MAYAAEVLADSPLLYWRLGETVGSAAADASGNGRDGTYVGSPTLGASGLLYGDTNKAVSLDGLDDYVTRSPGAVSSAFTIELWYQSSSTPLVLATQWPTTSGQRVFFLGGTAGRFYFEVRTLAGGDVFFNSDTPFVNDAIFHVVGTYDGATMSLYVNGQLDKSSTALSGPVYGGAPALQVGARTAAPVFDSGIYDEVAYYDHALSAERVLAHYLAGTHAVSAAAVRLYPRDDGRGMSSTPRLWPPPKSRRIIGGYP